MGKERLVQFYGKVYSSHNGSLRFCAYRFARGACMKYNDALVEYNRLLNRFANLDHIEKARYKFLEEWLDTYEAKVSYIPACLEPETTREFLYGS
jgi:hypothetical protein